MILSFKIKDDMPIKYDIEDDYLYKKGFEKGFKMGLEKVINKKEENRVMNFILQTDFTDEMIADLIAVDIDFVKKIRANLKK